MHTKTFSKTILSHSVLLIVSLLIGCKQQTNYENASKKQSYNDISSNTFTQQIRNEVELLRERINRENQEEPSSIGFGGSSWKPNGSEYIYHQNGSSSWQPQGSNYIYHTDGSSSWQPPGSNYIYHQDGSSSWKPDGSQYIHHQDGTSSWKP